MYTDCFCCLYSSKKKVSASDCDVYSTPHSFTSDLCNNLNQSDYQLDNLDMEMFEYYKNDDILDEVDSAAEIDGITTMQQHKATTKSKFLDGNEGHVIWKPARSSHSITTANGPIDNQTNSFTVISNVESCDYPDGDDISLISRTTTATAKNFTLRKQQLFTVVKEAHKRVLEREIRGNYHKM